MRICYISNLFPPRVVGGAELFAASLADAMARKGHDVTVITTSGGSSPSGPDTPKGVKVIPVKIWNIYQPFSSAKRPLPARFVFHAWDSANLFAYQKILNILHDLKPDLVHTHNVSGFGEMCWLAAKRLRIPLIHTAHDYHLLCPRATLLRNNGSVCEQPALLCKAWRYWHMYLTKHIDWFVTPSEFMLREHESAGLQAKNTKMIMCGINLPSYLSETISSTEDRPIRFLFIGQLAKHKGIVELLTAFKKVIEEEGAPPIELYVAGKGPLENLVRSRAAEISSIKFMGFVTGDEKDRLFRHCDVLVIPSKWPENAPICVMEATSYKLPVIGSKMGGIPELVVDGETGILFEPGTEQLSMVIKKLIYEPHQLKILKARVSSYCARFSLFRSVNSYEELYSKLLT